ncbi:inositol 1,4,5-trisphosphate receptor type 3-like [Dysidea avara]|uniref:inositol 1,4,5-trisphosphate receptor type 3-like n=1 Tax=Dysidea avara TaxID=196820 RepID=UPI00332E026F
MYSSKHPTLFYQMFFYWLRNKVYKYLHKPQVVREHSYSDEPVFGVRPIYHIVFVMCSVLSLRYYGYFYCLCLLHIVIDNDILKRVLKSVTKHVGALLWIGTLGLIILFIYAEGTFAFLANEFDNRDSNNVLFCSSLAQCFITVLRYGLPDPISLAADLPQKFESAAFRVIFYDVTYFIIVASIGMAIVFAVIVDTFTELRDQRWHIEEDKKAYCFICGYPSVEFERKTKTTFDHHVKYEHCMWDYIYYYLHLKRIDVNDHTAIECYVYNLIESDEVDFFPLHDAKCITTASDEALKEIEKLNKKVDKLVESFEHQKQAAALRKKRMEEKQWDKKFTT